MDVDDCNGQSNISGWANFITDLFSVDSISIIIYFIVDKKKLLSFYLQLVETLQWKESFLGASGVQQ